MNLQRNYWNLCHIWILFMFSVHFTESTRCDWEHSSNTYEMGNCETTTVVCRNVTLETIDDFHDEQVTEDCDSKRCYAIDIHNSSILSLTKEILAVKLSCKLYEIALTNVHIHTVANDTFSNCPKVWKVNLQDNFINTTDFLVGEFKNLRILNLALNKLETLKRPAFDSLKQLNMLYLNNNIINSIEDEVFKRLTNLRQLNLANNKLQTIPKNMLAGLNELNDLYLQENPIKSIEPGAFASLNKLIALNLTGSKIDALKNNTFMGLSHLETLTLANLNVKNIEPGAFNTMDWLVNLDLHKNNLEAVEEDTFFNLRMLKTLDLSYNKISLLKVESFTGLINLRKLFLNDNIIKELPYGTFQSFPLLENLQLGNNYLSRLGRESFSNLPELKYLNLSHNVFSEFDVTVLFSLPRLTSLKLDNNHLSELNFKILLLHLPKLSFISINNNNWTCSLLADMLKAFKIKKIEYMFEINLKHSEDGIQGILCTNRTVQESKHESQSLSDNSKQIEDMLKDLTSSTNDLSETLKAMKERIDELSHPNNIVQDDSAQKDVKDILNKGLLTNEVLNQLQHNFSRFSVNSNDYYKNVESNLEKISDFLKENQNKTITEEQLLNIVGNVSKIVDKDDIKTECNSNYGLYVIAVFILILFTCIVMLLGFKYFKINRKSGFGKSRSEIELLNAS